MATVLGAACTPQNSGTDGATLTGDLGGETLGTQRWWLQNDGNVRVEADPYAPRTALKGEYDTFVTRLAPGVAMVVEPAVGAPAEVSNLLGDALVRRFGGRLPGVTALDTQRILLIRPHISQDKGTINGSLIVDWRLADQSGKALGAVFAQRKLTGVITNGDPLTAITRQDAEMISIQTASHLLEFAPVVDAINDTQTLAMIETTPAPRVRPQSVIKTAAIRATLNNPTPNTGQAPRKRPAHIGTSEDQSTAPNTAPPPRRRP
ncbi:MAG: hypothetical protein ACPGGK_10105 [Pikeienuella sp.]